VALFFTAMALNYIVLYSALEEDSPSLTIVLHVAQAGSQGCSSEEVFGLIQDDLIVRSRLEAMLAANLVVCDGGVYRLTTQGRKWARLFGLFRALLRLPKGG
jgi:hypothetical protein